MEFGVTISQEVHRSLHVGNREPRHEAIVRDTAVGSGEQFLVGMQMIVQN